MRNTANVLRTRSSGLLLHITCLPSEFGIGDIGPEAYRFVDFLSDSGMRYWQLLPLTAMRCGGEYSPYDCISAFAGNKYLISPVMMQSAGYLSVQDLRRIPHFTTSKVDYVLRFASRTGCSKGPIRFSGEQEGVVGIFYDSVDAAGPG